MSRPPNSIRIDIKLRLLLNYWVENAGLIISARFFASLGCFCIKRCWRFEGFKRSIARVSRQRTRFGSQPSLLVPPRWPHFQNYWSKLNKWYLWRRRNEGKKKTVNPCRYDLKTLFHQYRCFQMIHRWFKKLNPKQTVWSLIYITHIYEVCSYDFLIWTCSFLCVSSPGTACRLGISTEPGDWGDWLACSALSPLSWAWSLLSSTSPFQVQNHFLLQLL